MSTNTTAKADPNSATKVSAEPQQQQSTDVPEPLEEDDEFEDFPVDDWPASEQEVPTATLSAGVIGNDTTQAVPGQHLWEESWDDDDESEAFSKQLRAELDKVKRGGK